MQQTGLGFIPDLRNYYIGKILNRLPMLGQKQWISEAIKEKFSEQWNKTIQECENTINTNPGNMLNLSLLPIVRAYWLNSDAGYLNFIRMYIKKFIELQQDNTSLIGAKLQEILEIFYLLLEDKRWTDEEFESLFCVIHQKSRLLPDVSSLHHSADLFCSIFYLSNYFPEFHGSHKRLRLTLPVFENFILDNILADGFHKDIDTGKLLEFLETVIKSHHLFNSHVNFSHRLISILEKSSVVLANCIMPDGSILYNTKGLTECNLYPVIQKLRFILGKKLFDFPVDKTLDMDSFFVFGKKYIDEIYGTGNKLCLKSAASYSYSGVYIQRAGHLLNSNTLLIRAKKQPGFDMFLSQKCIIQEQGCFNNSNPYSVDLWSVGKRKLLRIKKDNSTDRVFLLEANKYWVVVDLLKNRNNQEIVIRYNIKSSQVSYDDEKKIISVNQQNCEDKLIILPISNFLFNVEVLNNNGTSALIFRSVQQLQENSCPCLICIFHPFEIKKQTNLKARSTFRLYGPSTITIFRDNVADSIPFGMLLYGEESSKGRVQK
jgi:hypothetical protein